MGSPHGPFTGRLYECFSKLKNLRATADLRPAYPLPGGGGTDIFLVSTMSNLLGQPENGSHVGSFSVLTDHERGLGDL